MSRVATPNLSLGCFDDSDNPGAGSKTVDSTGLNGNWIKLDTAVGAEHNADGTHKAAKIDGANLKSTVADASTIVQDAITKKLGVPTGGITSTQLGASAVIAGKIKGSGTGKAVDGTSIQLNANNELELMDDSVTAAKITHDNNRTKFFFTLTFDSVVNGTYAKKDGVATTAVAGVVMPRDGIVTAINVCHGGGSIASISNTYALGGLGSFSDGDRIHGIIAPWTGGDHYISIVNINTATDFSGGSEAQVLVSTAPAFVTIEVEFDD